MPCCTLLDNFESTLEYIIWPLFKMPKRPLGGVFKKCHTIQLHNPYTSQYHTHTVTHNRNIISVFNCIMNSRAEQDSWMSNNSEYNQIYLDIKESSHLSCSCSKLSGRFTSFCIID